MRILYLSLSYVPSRRASSVQVMKMCAAMARLGHEVVLVAKRNAARTESGVDDLFAFYGVEPSFTVERLPRPARRGGGLLYAAAVARELAARKAWADLVYCRDLVGAATAAALGCPVLFEAHGVPAGRLQVTLWRRVLASPHLVALVTISDALRRDMAAAGLLPATGAIVAHDASDMPVRRASRRSPRSGRPRIGYVGNLYPGRGIELILELAARMPECQFDVVGGTESDIARWREKRPPENVVFHGFHPPSELERFYREFDAVLMPHSRQGVLGASGSQDISRWTSPMKMFEYMASGVPMIASDLPVLQEVLRDGQNALIARAGDAAGWEARIRDLLADPDMGVRLARRAQDDLAERFTWDARARLVLSSLPCTRKSAGEPALAS